MYAFVEAEKVTYPIALLCRVSGVAVAKERVLRLARTEGDGSASARGPVAAQD